MPCLDQSADGRKLTDRSSGVVVEEDALVVDVWTKLFIMKMLSMIRKRKTVLVSAAGRPSLNAASAFHCWYCGHAGQELSCSWKLADLGMDWSANAWGTGQGLPNGKRSNMVSLYSYPFI